MTRILLIDDHRVSIDQAHALLRRDGYDLIEATDALAGLHRAVEDAPDCVVVDLDLAGLDGLEVCRRLVGSGAAHAVPVVVWGTAEAKPVSGLAQQAGAFAYVDRGRMPGALRGVVRRAVLERAGRTAAAASTSRARSGRLPS